MCHSFPLSPTAQLPLRVVPHFSCPARSRIPAAGVAGRRGDGRGARRTLVYSSSRFPLCCFVVSLSLVLVSSSLQCRRAALGQGHLWLPAGIHGGCWLWWVDLAGARQISSPPIQIELGLLLFLFLHVVVLAGGD